MGRAFSEGNEAVARGAIRAGCDFFASYPITPASSILRYMLHLLPQRGGVVVQAEDEIAAIGMCIAASIAGRKVLTSTSGPGISLYSENIGLAIMGETPLVIVDVQRQGPATGSATKGADSDIQFAQWGTSGGLPIIALCPATNSEAFELTYRAFNLAEQYRTPVIVLTNKEIGVTMESFDEDECDLPPRYDRRRVEPAADGYLPHRFEQLTDVPLISDMGGPHVARFTTSTHDQTGYLTTKPEVIQQMIDHYAAKIHEARNDMALFREDLQPEAETLVISYGVTARSAAAAVREARGHGARVSSLYLQTLWPVPEKAILDAMAGVRKVVVPEMNMGQYRREIERLAPPGVEVVGVCKMNTTLVSPREIIQQGGL